MNTKAEAGKEGDFIMRHCILRGCETPKPTPQKTEGKSWSVNVPHLISLKDLINKILSAKACDTNVDTIIYMTIYQVLLAWCEG